MVSHRSYIEIIRLTDAALRDIGQQAADRITVIHGYMQLLSQSSGQAEMYEGRLADALRDLLRLAIKNGKTRLVEEFQTLLATIDEERTA